ncbi:MAG: hypothetical protein COA97_02375 [Flavobacteriales bacterium]|nr:MAG: hypothetical protein COA97_02375 [Flavobacteriales bacterium]
MKEGFWIIFYESGNAKEKSYYLNGEKNGGSKTYYENGEIKIMITYINDKPNGLYQAYYESGSLKETGIWKDKWNFGSLTRYYENGNIQHRYSFGSKAKRVGYQIDYHPNGIISYFSMKRQKIQREFYIAYNSLGEDTLIKYYVGDSIIIYKNKGSRLKISDADKFGVFNGVREFVNAQNALVYKKREEEENRISMEINTARSEAKIKSQNIRLDNEKKIKYYLYFGLILLLIIITIIYIAFRNKKKDNAIIAKQKNEVQKQKDIIEQTHQEITDSIIYAKRIQNAILPPDKVVKEYLKESFIFYKPKDIVAGDFYWMESVASPSNKKETIVLFAAADCTGHGVPGAMVSVVCNNGLNRSVREHRLSDPGEILDKTREIIIQEFEKSDDDVKDGMDIALCSLEGNKLLYAGANNPLWIIRNGKIIETKANKQPIGQFDNPEPYTTHAFELEKGDSIYIFSDGYVDQFGGEKGKKFKPKAFRELLLSIQDKSMEEQKKIIDDAFETWRGTIEQVDDVCIIGVKV